MVPHAIRWRSPRRLVAAAVAGAMLVTGLGFTAAGRATAATAATAADQDYPAGCPWMNTRISADQRASLLLAASTLDQKLRWLDEQAANTPAQTTFGGVTYPAQVPCTPTVVYTDRPDYVRLTKGVTIFPTLRPGQAQQVSITIDPGSAAHPLGYWDTAHQAWATAPGTYGVQVGSSSEDLPLGGSVQVAR